MSFVKVTASGPVATVLLDRPEKRNALTIEMLQEIAAAFREIEKSAKARVVVLRGEGASFCTGLDLLETKDRAKARISAKSVGEALRSILDSSAVTIAAVQGHATAGGAGLMSACDFAIAEKGTMIGYPEVRRGLVAAMVMTLLQRQVGDRKARELLLLGELINADTALAIGLATRVVPKGGLNAAVQSVAASLLKNAPGALTESKRLLDDLGARSADKAFAIAEPVALRMRRSSEAAEGLAAFEEKRNPSWVL